MLHIRNLHAFYDKSHILHGVDLDVGPGEIVSILGRNGSGRSTTLKAIMGSVRTDGSIRFRDEELGGTPAFRIARKGIGYVPESRDVFPGLTVRQNLILGMKPGRRSQWSLEDTWHAFPRLKERADTQAGFLSGGEQQMLTICRTMMGNPELIIVDEPTEGLSPQMVERVGDLLMEIARRGSAILLVEQKLAIAMRISHRVYVMGHGRMVFSGTPASFADNTSVRAEWLEV
jgi:branched-chain amino acid transport system ATP-binding protein